MSSSRDGGKRMGVRIRVQVSRTPYVIRPVLARLSHRGSWHHPLSTATWWVTRGRVGTLSCFAVARHPERRCDTERVIPEFRVSEISGTQLLERQPGSPALRASALRPG